MLEQRRWDIVHRFEHKLRESTLKSLTPAKSLKIFNDLYQFGQKIDKAFYKRFEPENVQALAKVHSIFMKVKA